VTTIEVDDRTYDELGLLALAWQTTRGDAVGRLLSEAKRATRPEPNAEDVPVHFEYEGERVAGLFHRSKQSLTITTGSLAGNVYKKPSPAALAVINLVNPDVSGERNGWGCWIVDSTGQPVQSLRHH
jgi:hypothetical protein